MPTILKREVISELEKELSVLKGMTGALSGIVALVDKSKLFHLRSDVARARRANSRALAGNDINQKQFEAVEKALDEVLKAGGAL